MKASSYRLRILLDPATRRRLEAEARRRGVSVSALVREAIWRFLEGDVLARRAAVERLAGLEAPVADWETMKREIELAYMVDEIWAALAAHIGVELKDLWEAMLQMKPSERERVIREVFRSMTMAGRIPHPSSAYEEPFKRIIEARLLEAMEDSP